MNEAYRDISLPATSAARRPASRRRRSGLRIGSVVLSTFAGLALALAAGIFLLQTTPLWHRDDTGFPFGRRWYAPAEQFGALAMVYGTAMVAAVAMLLAGPIGIGAALFMAEILPRRSRLALKSAVELLAGVPSVVYGLLGILLLRDVVYRALSAAGLEPLSGDSLLTAGLLLAVMLLPTVVTLADDALRGVPVNQRLAARALGLTRTQAIVSVVVPQAWRGLLAALLLATGRALGEMIAVYLVVGRRDNQLPSHLFSLRPLVSAGQTLSSKLGGPETDIALGDPPHWAAVVGLGLLLALLTGGVTLAGACLARVRLAGRSDRHA